MQINLVLRLWLIRLVCVSAALWHAHLQAQAVYRILHPDGHVTFSDKPPVTNVTNASKVTTVEVGPQTAETTGADDLPFALRQVVKKYPVTLYTSGSCEPCDSGRALLTSRGVPFTEKTIATLEDSQALKRLSGDPSLPLLTIGTQQLRGFSASEWTQYLDAAAYPPKSVLQTDYRRPAASPLVEINKQDEAKPADSPQSNPALSPMPTWKDPVSNPAGIQF